MDLLDTKLKDQGFKFVSHISINFKKFEFFMKFLDTKLKV